MTEKSLKPSKTTEYVRHWSFIVYPESAPEHWQDIIDQYHIPWACSPLHDADENPDGETKKPHWHVVVSFEGKKSYNQVLDIIRPLNCTVPQKVQSMKGMLRYFVHLDNPEKHQYSINDIELHGGFDPQSYLSPSSTQKYMLINEMVNFIEENHVYDYLDFMKYAAAHRFDDWYPLLCDSCSFVIDKVITSNWKKKKNRGTSNEIFCKCSVCDKEYPVSLMAKCDPSDYFSIDNVCLNCWDKFYRRVGSDL